MARPKKTKDEKRSCYLKARLTVAEKLYAEEQAGHAGLTLAEFTRRRVLGLPVRPPKARADAALITELNRIGVNINQLAHAANTGRDLPNLLAEAMRDLEGALEKVVLAYDS